MEVIDVVDGRIMALGALSPVTVMTGERDGGGRDTLRK